jgi:hypothetical protein
MDKKYDLYRNAEFDFYNTLTSKARQTEIIEIRRPIELARGEKVSGAYKTLISK